MRTAFIKTLTDLAARDDRIILIVGDLGFGAVERFAKQFPDRFINAGVAEQNMTGIAAGLALSGKVVFTYSIANFPTLRCLEQVRNDICYHRANVKIVSVGGGLAYGPLGTSHHATEDIAVMRALPEMTVMAPGDPVETEAAVRALVDYSGPAYLRLGRAGEPAVHSKDLNFSIGKAIRLGNGGDLTLISTGAVLGDVMAAAEALAGKGVYARVLSMHTVKPLDETAILCAAHETSAIMTVEEHSAIGGLGSAVAEVLAERANCAIPFKRLGLHSKLISLVGSQEFLKKANGLSIEGITNSAIELHSRAHASRSLSYAF